MDESRNVREKQFSLSRALSFCTIDANIAVTRSIFIGLSRAWQARGIQGSGEIRYSRWLCDPLIHCLDEASSGSPPGESGAVALVKRRILIWRMRKFQGGLALLLRNSPRWHAKESVKGKRRAVTICKKRILDAVRLGRIAERPLCQCRRVQKKSENKKNLYPHLTNNGVSSLEDFLGGFSSRHRAFKRVMMTRT